MKDRQIKHQAVAESVFDFSVNAGIQTASKLAQKAAGAKQDGKIGPLTLQKINSLDEELFILKFTLAKIARYAEICNKNKKQKKFLLGWINRSLKTFA
ncbi:MAG: putative peptidoglycan-binding domain-containing protein [Nitrospiria bacterium]